MLFYQIVSVICLLILLANAIQVIYQVYTYSREERIAFLRDYKKGKFVIIYLVALPLYFLANYYVTGQIVDAVETALSNSVGLVTLVLDSTGNTEVLAGACELYRWALNICYAMAYINFGLFVWSIFYEYLATYTYSLKFHLSTQTKCVIIGNNAGSITLYETCDEKQKMLVDLLSKDDKTALYMKGVQSLSFARWPLVYAWILREGKRMARIHARKKDGLFFSRNKLVVIVNTGDDTQNLKICDALVTMLKEHGRKVAGCLQIHVYGNSEHADVYGEYEKQAMGCMEYIDKYTLSAIEMIDQYPMTQYLDDRHLDTQTSLIKPNVDLNVVFIGFGKRNRQAFMTMVANNQFLMQTEDGLAVKPVKYHLFDKADNNQHKNLNHTYYRYRHNFVENQGEVDVNAYLPLPNLPAEECYHCLDIHSISFYDEIKKIVCTNKTSMTHIVISFGSDVDNADLAHKILVKLSEWGVSDAHVFVKIKDENLSAPLAHLLSVSNCHLFGNKNSCDYNYACVVNEKFQNMALQRNYIYDVEYDLGKKDAPKITEEYLCEKRIQSRRNWFVKRSYIERESNVFACLSLRQKLQLMGLNYCPEAQEGEGLSYEQYISKYAGEDKPKLGAYHAEIEKWVVDYDMNFALSRRYHMAVQEHYRWNAYMITKGFVPASKECILTDKKENGDYSNGKSYLLRRHGNLTTMDGLVQFRKLVAQRNGTNEEKEDVIKYDYQILDDAYWLLKRNGYKIIKR